MKSERDVPLTVKEFQETPNPNALKCVLDRVPAPLAEGGASGAGPARSYASAVAAAGDPLARGLFEIVGVTNVLIVGAWVTVNKSPEASWKTLKPAIRDALSGAL